MRARVDKPILSALCSEALWRPIKPDWRHVMCRSSEGRFIAGMDEQVATIGVCTCPCHKINAPVATNILDNEIASEVYTLT